MTRAGQLADGPRDVRPAARRIRAPRVPAPAGPVGRPGWGCRNRRAPRARRRGRRRGRARPARSRIAGTARPRAAGARNSRRRSPAAGSASTSRRARCGDWSARTGAGPRRCGSAPPGRPAASVEIADRGAFGGAELLDRARRRPGVELDVPPRHLGIGRDDLHRLVEPLAEPGHQVADAGRPPSCTASRSRSASSGPVTRDVQLHGVQVVAVPCAALAWKSRPCCSGVSGRTSAIRYCCCSSSICCWLRRAGAMSDGVSPPPPDRTWAQMPASASNHNSAQPCDLRRGRAPTAPTSNWRADAGPSSVSTVPALSSTRVRQRHRHAAAAACASTTCRRLDPPEFVGELGRVRAQAAEVVEADGRVRGRPGRRRRSGSAAARRSDASGSARNCSLASLITAPNAAVTANRPAPRTTHPRPSDTGYFVVNHPTVRDRSTCAAISSSSRPWPSTSMPTGSAPVPRNSATANPNAINNTSCTPA